MVGWAVAGAINGVDEEEEVGGGRDDDAVGEGDDDVAEEGDEVWKLYFVAPGTVDDDADDDTDDAFAVDDVMVAIGEVNWGFEEDCGNGFDC